MTTHLGRNYTWSIRTPPKDFRPTIERRKVFAKPTASQEGRQTRWIHGHEDSTTEMKRDQVCQLAQIPTSIQLLLKTIYQTSLKGDLSL